MNILDLTSITSSQMSHAMIKRNCFGYRKRFLLHTYVPVNNTTLQQLNYYSLIQKAESLEFSRFI